MRNALREGGGAGGEEVEEEEEEEERFNQRSWEGDAGTFACSRRPCLNMDIYHLVSTHYEHVSAHYEHVSTHANTRWTRNARADI